MIDGRESSLIDEVACTREVWAKALEGWNVTESKQVQEWQAQAYKRGRDEGCDDGEVIGQIQFCQKYLKQAVSSRDDLLQKTRDELIRLAAQLEQQVMPGTNGHS